MPPGESNVQVQLTAEIKRLDEVIKANFDRLADLLNDHVRYTKERFDSEMKRIADVRGIDEGNRTAASTAASEIAAGLAKQLVDTETSGRALVASTAEAAARRQELYVSQVDARFLVLNDARKKTEGREGISAPLMMMLAAGAGALIMWFLKISVNLPILK